MHYYNWDCSDCTEPVSRNVLQPVFLEEPWQIFLSIKEPGPIIGCTDVLSSDV